MNDIYDNADAKKNDFFEDVYGVLFCPKETFGRLRQNPPIIEALAIVVAVSVLSPLINASFTDVQSLNWFVFSLFSVSFTGIIKWVFFAAFVEGLASIFKKGGKDKFKALLALSGFALLPWLFIAPVTLLKTGGILFSLLGVLAGIAIWIWTTILTIFAAMKVYDISSGRILLLLAVPFIGGIVFFNWIIGFFTTLTKLLGS